MMDAQVGVLRIYLRENHLVQNLELRGNTLVRCNMKNLRLQRW